MQNNINIINIPPFPPPPHQCTPLPTNAQSTKGNSTCKPQSHGRHQSPIPPSPPLHGGQIHSMCEKSQVGTVLPENKCPPTNAQNTTHQETHNAEAAPPPSHPPSHQRTAPEKVNKRNTRQNPHSHPAPLHGAEDKWKSEAGMCKKSRVDKNAEKPMRNAIHAKNTDKRCERESLLFLYSVACQVESFLLKNTAKTYAKTKRKFYSR